jgi:hypothetical protein
VIWMKNVKGGMQNGASSARRVSPFYFSFSAFCFLLFLAACTSHPKNDPTEAANTFFQLLNAGKTDDAYKSASFSFQASQSLDGFEQTVHELGLDDYSAITWTHRDVAEKEASLEGEITKKNDAKVPVAVSLVNEAGKWKLFTLRTSGKGDASPTENHFTMIGRGSDANDIYSQRKIPPKPELIALARSVLLKLNDGIKKKDFTDFYESVSNTWRNQMGLSKSRIERTYQPFIDAGVTMDDVAKVDPIFTDPPLINSSGLLVLNGVFPTSPNRVRFKIELTYEMPEWKLFGIDVALIR